MVLLAQTPLQYQQYQGLGTITEKMSSGADSESSPFRAVAPATSDVGPYNDIGEAMREGASVSPQVGVCVCVCVCVCRLICIIPSLSTLTPPQVNSLGFPLAFHCVKMRYI